MKGLTGLKYTVKTTVKIKSLKGHRLQKKLRLGILKSFRTYDFPKLVKCHFSNNHNISKTVK